MRFVWCVIAIWLAAAAARAHPTTFNDSDLGRAIVKGVATADGVWLLGSLGKVVHLDRPTGRRTVVAEQVRDMIAMEGRLWVLKSTGELGGDFALVDLRSNPEAQAGIEAERSLYLHPGRDSEGEVIGLLAWPGSERPAVLAARAIAIPQPGGWRRDVLPADLHADARVAAASESTIYVGYDRGEWGGGLRRIDLPSGTISFVSEAGDTPCVGVLPPACSPIVGIHPDRAKAGCVTVGTGISHIRSSRGHVFRVCGSDIGSVFSTPLPNEPDKQMMFPTPWPLHGLFEADDGWVGVSRNRYFRSRDGSVAEFPMPTFKNSGGIQMSEEREGIVFVVSRCCWGSEAEELYSAIALPVRP